MGKSKVIELWVACETVVGNPTSTPNSPAHIKPQGILEQSNCIAKKIAYESKKGVYGAARYCGFSGPLFEDENIIIYRRIGYYSKQVEYSCFVRKLITKCCNNLGNMTELIMGLGFEYTYLERHALVEFPDKLTELA